MVHSEKHYPKIIPFFTCRAEFWKIMKDVNWGSNYQENGSCSTEILRFTNHEKCLHWLFFKNQKCVAGWTPVEKKKSWKVPFYMVVLQ